MTTRWTRGLLAVALLALAGAAPAADRLVLVRAGGAPSALPGGVSLLVETAGFQALWDRDAALVSAFPLPDGRAVDLELARFEVMGQETRFEVVDEAGARAVTGPDMRFFKGRVAGDADSRAYLSLFDGRLAGFIVAGGQTWTVGPRSARLESAAGSQLDVVATDRVAPALRPDPLCAGAVDTGRPTPEIAPPAPGIDASTKLRAYVAIDTALPYYEHFGSVTSAQTYVASLLGAVSTIYDTDVNTQLSLGPLRVYTTAGPYTASTPSTLLAQIRSEWNQNRQTVKRTVAHLLTVEPGQGGIAYLNVLCNSQRFGAANAFDYGVSSVDGTYTYPNAGYTWDADVLSHELGHNFSSPHTHCYVPEIDQCYNQEAGCYNGTAVASTGTIMSYCHLTAGGKNLTFSTRERTEKIRPGIETAYNAGVPVCMDLQDPPALLVVDPRVAEGDSGTKSLTFTVRLSQPAPSASVSYATGGGTATAGVDYTAKSGTLVYTGTTQTAKTVSVPIVGDLEDERAETFNLNLSAPAGAVLPYTKAVGTITDNDPAPPGSPTLAIADRTLTEGNTGTKGMAFTLTLSGPGALTVWVDYATANGTATAGSDYVAKSGTLVFAPGITQKTLTVTVNGDSADERNETFTVTLSAPVNATFLDKTALGTVTDNDPAPGGSPAVSVADKTRVEGNTGTSSAGFAVTLSAASAQTVFVDYATADATALAGSDYVAKAGTLTFSPGTTARTASVAVNGDTAVEPTETFTLTLSAPVNATLGDAQATGTITNDD